MKSVTSSNQTADRKAGADRNTANTTKNAEKKAASVKTSGNPSRVTHGKNALSDSPKSLSVRISTIIPKSLMEKIEETARRRDGNRSAVLTECLSKGLSSLEVLPDMPLPEADRKTGAGLHETKNPRCVISPIPERLYSAGDAEAKRRGISFAALVSGYLERFTPEAIEKDIQTINAPENAGKEAANEKPPVASSSSVIHGENSPPALPDMPLPEADRQTLRRAFHLLLSKRCTSIDIEEEMLFQDSKNDKKKGVFTNEARADYMAEYGRLKEETAILSMLEKGVSPDSILNAQILTDGEIKPEWQSYLCLLAELYSMFATPEEMEA